MPGKTSFNYAIFKRFQAPMSRASARRMTDTSTMPIRWAALLTGFGNWISNGKKDDSLQSGPLTQPGLLDNPPPTFPNASPALLFVASFPQDDGRRVGDGEAAPGVPVSHVAPTGHRRFELVR